MTEPFNCVTSQSARGLIEESLPTLNRMFRRRLDHVDMSHGSNQQKISVLHRLWRSIPVLFCVVLAYLCCVQVTDVVEVQWLYSEHLRFISLNQKQRNDETLSTLASHWDCCSQSITPLTFNGKMTCQSCYRQIHGMSKAVSYS